LRTCSDIDRDAFQWYPDADRLAYTVMTAGTAGNHVVGSYTTRLSDSTIAPIGGPVPVWAKSGSRAALQRGNLLEVVDPTGTPLAGIPLGRQPVWSPDGEWLAYVGVEDEFPQRYYLWVADRSGGRRRRIALDANEPDWRP
jgi:hypothetical protein